MINIGEGKKMRSDIFPGSLSQNFDGNLQEKHLVFYSTVHGSYIRNHDKVKP